MAGKNYLKRMDFGNEAADDVDDEELKSYFVMQEGFENFLKENKRIKIKRDLYKSLYFSKFI